MTGQLFKISHLLFLLRSPLRREASLSFPKPVADPRRSVTPASGIFLEVASGTPGVRGITLLLEQISLFA